MIADHKRLLALLEPQGFTIGYTSDTAWQISFVRRSKIAGVFESIFIHGGGKNSESVYAKVGCSILPGRTALRRGLLEDELIKEVASAPDGWTTFHSEK